MKLYQLTEDCGFLLYIRGRLIYQSRDFKKRRVRSTSLLIFKSFLSSKITLWLTFVSVSVRTWFCGVGHLEIVWWIMTSYFTMTSFKLQNHEFQIPFRYLSIEINIYCVNSELYLCWRGKCENLFTQEYHISREQRPRWIWYSWVNFFFIFPEPACYECFIIPNETKKTHGKRHKSRFGAERVKCLRQRSNGLKICLPAVFYMYVFSWFHSV
jgi:hypothetical protein